MRPPATIEMTKAVVPPTVTQPIVAITLTMIANGPMSMFLSQSTARTLFGGDSSRTSGTYVRWVSDSSSGLTDSTHAGNASAFPFR